MKIKLILFCIILNAILASINGQSIYYSSMNSEPERLSYCIFTKLYKNQKELTLDSRRDRLFLFFSDSTKKIIWENLSEGYFRISLPKENILKNDSIEFIIKHRGKYYDFSYKFNFLDTNFCVIMCKKYIDNIWSKCFWRTKAYLKRGIEYHGLEFPYRSLFYWIIIKDEYKHLNCLDKKSKNLFIEVNNANMISFYTPISFKKKMKNVKEKVKQYKMYKIESGKNCCYNSFEIGKIKETKKIFRKK